MALMISPRLSTQQEYDRAIAEGDFETATAILEAAGRSGKGATGMGLPNAPMNVIEESPWNRIPRYSPDSMDAAAARSQQSLFDDAQKAIKEIQDQDRPRGGETKRNNPAKIEALGDSPYRPGSIFLDPNDDGTPLPTWGTEIHSPQLPRDPETGMQYLPEPPDVDPYGATLDILEQIPGYQPPTTPAPQGAPELMLPGDEELADFVDPDLPMPTGVLPYLGDADATEAATPYLETGMGGDADVDPWVGTTTPGSTPKNPEGAGGGKSGNPAKEENPEVEFNRLQQFAHDKFGWDKDKMNDIGEALLKGGLATLAGDSPYFGVNVGRGGMVGADAYFQAGDDREEQERQDWLDDMAQQKFDLEMEQAGLNRDKAKLTIEELEKKIKNAGRENPFDDPKSSAGKLYYDALKIAEGSNQSVEDVMAYLIEHGYHEKPSELGL